jgi:hypothetical protein
MIGIGPMMDFPVFAMRLGGGMKPFRSLTVFVPFIAVSLLISYLANFRKESVTTDVDPVPEQATNSECQVAYAPASLIAFCKMHDLEGVSQEQLRELFRAAGLTQTWYGLTWVEHMNTGQTRRRTSFYRLPDIPSEMYNQTLSGLSILMGHAFTDQTLDFARPRIVVIPESRMGDNPFKVLAELEESVKGEEQQEALRPTQAIPNLSETGQADPERSPH